MCTFPTDTSDKLLDAECDISSLCERTADLSYNLEKPQLLPHNIRMPVPKCTSAVEAI